MKRFLVNLGVVLGVIVVTGLIRLPLEQAMREDMREDKLLPEPMSMSKRNELGQAGYAATLGGLRPVLASYYYLKAHNQHVERDWYEMEKTFETVVAMQPDSDFYWDMAGWQLAINTSSLSLRNRSVGPAERLRLRDHYIEAGDDFLRRGLEHIPDSELLKSERIRLLTDIFRVPDFEEARKVSKSLVEQENLSHNDTLLARATYVYTIAAIAGREAEAYSEAIKLWEMSSDRQRVPSLKCVIYVLQKALDIPDANKISERELFYNPDMPAKLVELQSFIGKIKLTDNDTRRFILKDLYSLWDSSEPLKRSDILRAKIRVTEKALELKTKRIPESQFYYDQAHKNYLLELLKIRERFENFGGRDEEVYQYLYKEYGKNQLTKAQKEILGILQLRLSAKIPSGRKIPNYKLFHDYSYKRAQLYNYWSSVNNEVKSAIEKGNSTMMFRPTVSLLRELQAMEERCNVPIGQRIQSHTIYEDQPFVK